MSKAASSSGVEPTATIPMLLKCALTAGSRRAVTVSMWIRSTIAADVLAGTKKANHPAPAKRAPPRPRNAGQLRCQLTALGGGHSKSANLTASDLLEQRAAADLQVDSPGDRVRERGSIASIRHVRHLDARHLLKQLARQVRRRPYTGRRERNLTLVVSGE